MAIRFSELKPAQDKAKQLSKSGNTFTVNHICGGGYDVVNGYCVTDDTLEVEVYRAGHFVRRAP